MTTQGFLTESLGHWRHIRQGLIAELENIPADEFDFRPSPEVRSVAELGRHILEGSMMMVGELTRDEPNFQRQSLAEFFEEFSARARDPQDKTAILSLLAHQLEDGISRIERVGEETMMGPVTNFDGSSWSRLQWFFHSLTEEMYHRGQLVTYARLLGLVPALTRMIQAGDG